MYYLLDLYSLGTKLEKVLLFMDLGDGLFIRFHFYVSMHAAD